MKLKNVILLVLAVFLSLVLSACGNSGENTFTPQPKSTTTTTATATPVLETPTLARTIISPTATPISLVKPMATPKPTQVVVEPPDEKQFRWLKGIPCSPPCWEGITPGKTSRSEAFELLKKNPLIASTNEYGATKLSEYMIVWNWTGKDNKDGYNGGNLIYDDDKPGKPVLTISPEYSTVFFTFQDVIVAYGNPDYVLAYLVFYAEGDKASFVINFVYANLGFVTSTSYYQAWTDIPAITKDMRLNRSVTFFQPGIQNLSDIFQNPYLSNNLIPWQGFKEFDFYCREDNGRYCKYARH